MKHSRVPAVSLGCHTSSWWPLQPWLRGLAGGREARRCPSPSARDHPSCCDPIKIHYKGKKRVGQRVRGEKNEAASGLCLFLPLGPRAGKIKGGLGLCSQGLGEAQLNGVTLWEEETPMGHTASVWGPAHPPLAFAPSNTTPGHPNATQLPTDVAHPAPVRPAACRVGQRHGLQLHLGTEEPSCWSCKGGAFRTFLALKLVPSSYWGL